MRLPLRRRDIFDAKWMLQLKTKKDALQEVFWRPSWLNIGLRSVQDRLQTLCFQNIRFLNKNKRNINIFDFQGRPKMTQDRPKTASRGSHLDAFFAPFFASIFGHFLVRFWSHFGGLWGAQIGQFWHRFFDYFCMSFQDRPKTAQERPKTPQECPKRPPRGSKRPPRAPPRPCFGQFWVFFRSSFVLLFFFAKKRTV